MIPDLKMCFGFGVDQSKKKRQEPTTSSEDACSAQNILMQDSLLGSTHGTETLWFRGSSRHKPCSSLPIKKNVAHESNEHIINDDVRMSPVQNDGCPNLLLQNDCKMSCSLWHKTSHCRDNTHSQLNDKSTKCTPILHAEAAFISTERRLRQWILGRTSLECHICFWFVRSAPFSFAKQLKSRVAFGAAHTCFVVWKVKMLTTGVIINAHVVVWSIFCFNLIELTLRRCMRIECCQESLQSPVIVRQGEELTMTKQLALNPTFFFRSNHQNTFGGQSGPFPVTLKQTTGTHFVKSSCRSSLLNHFFRTIWQN